MAQARRKSSGKAHNKPRGIDSTALGMLIIGLVVGAAATALLYGIRSDQPAAVGGGLRALIAASKSKRATSVSVTDESPNKAEELPSTKLDFYTVLPEIEYVLPDDYAPDKQPDLPTSGQTEEGIFYMLQAGSYANFKDADRLKAELALAGLEAHIQKITVQDKGDYYRVRLGPFINLAKLARVHDQLRNQGINAMRLRISGRTPG